MIHYKTEQERFWASDFGDEYVDRNQSEQLFASNLRLFSNIISHMGKVESLIEIGANVGMNLNALQLLLPNVDLAGIEINQKAATILSKNKEIQVYNQSILDFQVDYQRDVVLSKGVLIHISPDALTEVYNKMYQMCKRYIIIAEYYNPTPVEIKYRGHANKLFKRDFAGELLKQHQDLSLVDYGFVYHKDNNFPQDDITWFLLEKKK
ncbi:pseudaminic acid biosynthesis-associated methylase [Heliorestis acidaminivorans]|uniref:Pseudaminic acid biosynthesis-associated methylase n=1 Tax=Heliorestis acidaminivorans TaxID=553427 RepID=A0A6I0ERE9_9FIRM|nr:pseudaminic acid biosynthesis-associated methylase [Heliorestis acidaminivorans]KAB2952939.1 pseudaminic acid biosynthesis-associated methylase [Heliorestis acidaminivorans]